MWPDLKKPGFHTHNIKLAISPEMDCWLNTLSYSLLQSYESGFCGSFLRPCVSLDWHFGAIGWSWLSCIGAWRAGQATKGWPLSVIFNLECCEHKKGPVGPQTGLLAFNCLHIPFCTPILSPPSTPTYHPYYYHLQYHYRHKKKLLKTAWISDAWRLFTHTIIAKE